MFLLYLIFHVNFSQLQMGKSRNEFFLRALLNLQEKKLGFWEKNRKSPAMKKVDITASLERIIQLCFELLLFSLTCGVASRK